MKNLDHYAVRKALEDFTDPIYTIKRNSHLLKEEELRVLKENMQLKSKKLFSLYVDTVLWAGFVDNHSYQTILTAMNSALSLFPEEVSDHLYIRQSLTERLHDFKFFSINMLE